MIASMTGYARKDGADDTHHWAWEVRSVNGKGLDMRIRIPSGLDGLDPIIRKKLSAHFKRGSMSISLDIRRAERNQNWRINEGLLDQLMAFCHTKGETVAPSDLLSIKGVVEQAEEELDEKAQKQRLVSLADDLELALVDMVKARQEEGDRIALILKAQIADIEALTQEAIRLAEQSQAGMVERVKKQLSDLNAANDLKLPDDDRIAQEVAVMLVKGDVREELDRLMAHCEAARDNLEKGGVIGRKLDFLCQEFNREANTLCSKSSDKDLTKTGLALKTTIDQLREQVANIE